MDLINFVQTGGFPVKAERLQEMQTAYSIFNELGNLAGNLPILSGCVVTGTSVTAGYVFINGEVLKFKAGFLGENVIVIQNESNKEFENGEIKAVHYERYATFGTNPDASWTWESFKRPDSILVLMARVNVLEKKTAIFQAGGVVFPWFLPIDQIPTGFAIVTNMAGKTIFGYDPGQVEFNEIGKTGGGKDVKLTASNIPELELKLKKSSNTSGGVANNFVVNVNNNEGEATLKVNSGSANTNVKILNPYRTAVYIEFIG